MIRSPLYGGESILMWIAHYRDAATERTKSLDAEGSAAFALLLLVLRNLYQESDLVTEIRSPVLSVAALELSHLRN